MKPFMSANATLQVVVVAKVKEDTNNWCNTSCQIARGNRLRAVHHPYHKSAHCVNLELLPVSETV